MKNGSAAQVTPDRIMQFTGGYAPPLLIETALRLGVFDLLDNGAMNISQLQTRTGASFRGLRAALNALVGLDLLIKNDDGWYELTPESSTFLVKGKPTFHGAFLLLTSEAMVPHWGKLTEVVRSGHPTHRINIEKDGSEFFLRFVEDIFPIHLAGAQSLAQALDVANARTGQRVLDLAAGSGVWSIALAKQSPHVHVTAVDWPAVIEITKKVAAREGVAERFRFIGGDLLEADFGTGYTIATAGHILHSEGEQRSRALLDKTFTALAPGGLIAIAEILVDPDRRGPLPALMFALNMLVHSEHGDTFSLPEISSWLNDAGFHNVRTVSAPGLARQIIIAARPNN
jgi:2-polyprenyl-3-methyl-5-hydroxy-6-metoxy-1,4-benzoquinol methylase